MRPFPWVVLLIAVLAGLWQPSPANTQVKSVVAVAVAQTPPPPTPVPEEGIKLDGNIVKVKVIEYIPVEVEKLVAQDFPIKLKAPVGGLMYSWDWPEGWKVKKTANVLQVLSAPKGQGTVSVEWPVIDFKSQTSVIKTAVITFYIGDVPAPVPPPVPPGPVPPVPPVPPDPKPTPVGALRVIFARESSAAAHQSKEMLNIWNSSRIAAYLNQKSAKDGNLPGWRKWDKDIKTELDPSPAMQQLWAKAKPLMLTQLPAMVVAVGPEAEVFPLSNSTEEEVLGILRKYAEGTKQTHLENTLELWRQLVAR
jgi:hypothetical protein